MCKCSDGTVMLHLLDKKVGSSFFLTFPRLEHFFGFISHKATFSVVLNYIVKILIAIHY